MNDNETGSGVNDDGTALIGAIVSLATSAAFLYGAYRIGKANGREEERAHNTRTTGAAERPARQ